MRIADETLDQLGKYYIHFNIWRRYHINFEQFVREAGTGLWKARMEHRREREYDRSRNL
ncbi:hypothetical protein ERICV_03346 [Paenibacillus larvae subsp. larvae]|uniref:Uncharacterized protein n=1 Tax=Paenibacillus larvae subsp. larvae TaxID=147375 RepID=A0A6C0QVI9_9BACL|nr:hypothetical protein ERICV_03346 [Paenibacillus larvae subsp. larvae]